jgi:hypothetical protein
MIIHRSDKKTQNVAIATNKHVTWPKTNRMYGHWAAASG